MNFVGRSVTRLEDRPLVTGNGRFAADVSFAHQLHMRVVRSPHAHARIRTIDTAAARNVPGVVAIWTTADVADIPPIDFRLTRIEGLDPYRQPILATDRVRYVGEPVAVVFATDPYIAEDAADLVTIEAEPLPALMDADAPPGAFDAGHSTEVALVRKSYGDVEMAFASAHAVVELDLTIGRHSGVPMETRGAIARVARGILELHGAAKVPHWNRDALARMLGREPSSMHLHEGHVGGGFGVRGEIYPEDVLVCLARAAPRPPGEMDRGPPRASDGGQPLAPAAFSRPRRRRRRRPHARHRRRVLSRPGRLYAHACGDRARSCRRHAARPLSHAGLSHGRPHPAHQQDAVRHLSRARPLREHLRARAADGCDCRSGSKIDPIEIRRRNLIAKSEMPFARGFDTLGTEMTYDSGDYAGLLDKALAAAGWDKLQADLRRRRAAGETVGAGLAMFVEKSGLGPFDGVRVTIDTSGAVEVVTGAASVGQGVETVIAQICADALGVDYRRVRVVHGQTDRIEYGMGAFASRVTVMTGEATRIAATKLRAKALAAAAELLQSAPETLDIVDGKVVRKECRRAGPSVTLGEVARALAPRQNSSASAARPFRRRLVRVAAMTYPYGVHIAVVRVDRDTGAVAVERYFVAYDVGRAVNPMLVEGQIAGGVAQGTRRRAVRGISLRRARRAAVRHLRRLPDADGARNSAGRVLITEDAPSPLNPLGLKGAGEGGANPVGAAIAAAIDDALGMPGAVTQLPVTPQRLRALLRRQPPG